MKVISYQSLLNFIFFFLTFLATQVTGVLLCLVICFIMRDFTWAFVRLALINSFLLGLALAGSCYLIQRLMFTMKIIYIVAISSSLVLGVCIISFFIVLFLEKTLFIYYDRGVFSFIFVNFLFIMTLHIISSVLIIYREIMAEKENAIVNERFLKNKMEMQLLSSRINPHFLFNTLNMIISLLKQPEKAEAAILNLSDLLRAQLDQSDKNRVSVQEELENVRKYLEIQKLRFNERLEFEIAGPDNFLIPPLIIQPLVENSIKHNMQIVTKLKIEILLLCTETHYIIRVIDSAKALRVSMIDKGNGLTITKKRVENNRGTFTIQNGGVEISFSL